MPKEKISLSAASRKAQALAHRLQRERPAASDFELADAFARAVAEDAALSGLTYPNGHVTEDWLCADCGVNTAPGIPDGKTLVERVNAAGACETRVGPDSEVYCVRDAVWAKAGVEPFGGCLCIGCLENRLGRRLKPKDFERGHALNELPGSPRLRDRQKF
jgi:hypothetical protein